MDTLSRLKDFDFELWTDGSFISELGAGAVEVYMKGREEPIYQASAPSGYLSSSYRAEMVAIYLISEKCAGTLLVASDSQSSITALEAAPPPLLNKGRLFNEVWLKLINLTKFGWKITFQSIFSHCSTSRNEAGMKLSIATQTTPYRFVL